MQSRAWYAASIADFLLADPDLVLGRLVANGDFVSRLEQQRSWLEQIELLRRELTGFSGDIFFEFAIPRMGRRIDVVVIIGPLIFVIEFKVGEGRFDRAAVEQVWDYALDLKNFHQGSHFATLLPILIATETQQVSEVNFQQDQDGVFHPIKVSPEHVHWVIAQAVHEIKAEHLDVYRWSQAAYLPTPTIIEAARALYAQHSVDAIARNDAGAKNLHLTCARVEYLVDQARQQSRKLICFVTGVPGAGKTLVGLNVATNRRDPTSPTHAVFLSGNGPLVAVISEALARDEVARKKGFGQAVRKGEVRERIKAFIQNVHHFRDEGLKNPAPPPERVVIFDEAQRAWNLKQTSHFMARKKNHVGFSQSEPEFLISCMDRHEDWAVVVCLVGGGQEINTGEAGIGTWLRAVIDRFPDWGVHISSRLVDKEYAAAEILEQIKEWKRVEFDDDLHLSVSMRSFRAEHVSSFVKALLDPAPEHARRLLAEFSSRYPLALTRDLSKAKHWIRERARGSERYGLIASSKAQRLKPDAIDIRVNIDPVHWFLNEREDTRSSFYLEDAATEFQVQGLELDWSCVTWDGDLRFNGDSWTHHDFRGSRWTNIKAPDHQQYLRNAYRVLLTRARQGMVIYVPEGDPKDQTRSSCVYDPTFEFLRDVGIPVLN